MFSPRVEVTSHAILSQVIALSPSLCEIFRYFGFTPEEKKCSKSDGAEDNPIPTPFLREREM